MDKFIGLDLGTTTVGIAYNDSLGFVHGIETFHFTKNQFIVARQHIIDVTNKYGIKNLVLGYPLSMKGHTNEKTEMVERFKADLEALDSSLNIYLQDERLTSVMAHNTLSALDVSHSKRMANVDKIAACYILDTFIQSRGNK